MKLKINRRRLIHLLMAMQIVLIGVIVVGIYLFVEYKHSNPPVEECRVKPLKNNKSGLVSHWSFDKIEEDRVEDCSGNNNSGKIRSAINRHFIRKMIKSYFDLNYIFGVYEIVKGVKGDAISVNGRQWVAGGNIDAYNTNTFTIAVWAWREHDKYSVPTIMAKGSWPQFDGWWLTTKPGERSVDMGIAWGKAFEHIESGFELPLREWHHIAVTMNNEEHEIQFFIDGLPYGKKHKGVHEWIVNWNHDLFIGDYDGSGRWPWDGKLDEARYYNKILSKEDIYKIYSDENRSLMVMNEKN